MRATTAALVLALVGAADLASAQRTSALAGMVRDPNGHPIANAALALDGRSLQAMSNDSGHFFLGGIPAGRNGFTVTKLGYSPVRFEVELQPDTTLVVNIPMKPVQSLPEVNVSGERISAKLLQMGFYDRKRVGIGSFVDYDRIERIAAGAMQPSSLLRDVRGVKVRCRAAGPCTVTNSSDTCMATFVNKVFVRLPMDEAVSAGDVYAIEVYERRILVPIDFTVPRAVADCGVVAIWTKGFADFR